MSRPIRLRKNLTLKTLEDRNVPSSVQGTVFDDANVNGVFEPGESGVAGWTVYLDANANQSLDPGELLAETNLSGQYFLDTTTMPGRYYPIRLDLETGSGWVNTNDIERGVDSVDEPAAVRNFGVRFEPFFGVEPVGAESLVNVTTVGQQELHDAGSIAADMSGNFVTTWRSLAANGTGTVFARVFNADGTPRTGELTVATGSVQLPEVAMSDNGRFAVAWSNVDGGSTFARVFKTDGTAVSGIITVAGQGKNSGSHMKGIAMDSDGDFAVLMWSLRSNENTLKIQRFTAAGSATGKAIETGANPISNGHEGIAMAGNGSFVVAWDNAPPNVIRAQMYSATGAKVGSLITVSQGGEVVGTNLTMNRAGQFNISWGEWGLGEAGPHIVARTYQANGTAGPVVIIGEGGWGDDIAAASAIDVAGNINFAWIGQEGIRYRRLTAEGVLEMASFATATNSPSRPGLAATGDDSFVAIWNGNGPGDNQGVFSQRFGPVSVAPFGQFIPGGNPTTPWTNPIPLTPALPFAGTNGDDGILP